MRVYNFNTLPKSVTSTATIQDFGMALGVKPHLAKEIISLPENKGLTAMKLTEQLGSVWGAKPKSLTQIQSFMYDWKVDVTDRIPKTNLAAAITESGEGGAFLNMTVEHDLFDRYNTVEITSTRQQFFIRKRIEPVVKNKVTYQVQLVADDYTKKVNTAGTGVGAEVKYLAGGYVPEMSEYGSSVKGSFNIETHRTFINRFRMDISSSGDFSALEDRFIQDAGGAFYKQEGREAMTQRQLTLAINNSMLFAHGNMTVDNKCLITEEDGRPIPIGEGIIPQARRFCGHLGYNTLTIQRLKDAIAYIVERRARKNGHKLVVLCNWRMYLQLQDLLDAVVGARLTVQDHFLEGKNTNIMVGADYAGYRYAGNQITLMMDEALTNRYPDKGFGIIINTKVDTNDGGSKLNIEALTIKGGEMFTNKIPGIGGMSGYSSGVVSSHIHANQTVYMAYRGVALHDPFSTFIFEEN